MQARSRAGESSAGRGSGPVVPEAVYAALSRKGIFGGASQEDAQEFLTYFVDQIHEELLVREFPRLYRQSHRIRQINPELDALRG